MGGRRAISALSVPAVGVAILIGGCGGGDSTTGAGSASGTTPAGQASTGAAMKHEDSMKKKGSAMHDEGSMHGGSMHEGSMHDEGSMHGG
jgi:hypothetical protein